MNNRQANGRRRGRGGQQRQGGNPSQGSGNRIDNRARGNAAQLLEKYKNLARDAQMQGDRVNAEYYLQFADHYFRVLSETRSRFEEQNPQRRPRDEFDGDDEEFDGEAEGPRADEGQREPRQQHEPRQQSEGRGRRDRDARPDRDERRSAQYANGHGEGREETAEASEATYEESADRPRRRIRTRREATSEEESGAVIDAAVLPPALGTEIAVSDEEPVKKPRRRRVAKGDDAEATAA